MAVSKVLLEQDRFAKLVRTSNTIVTLGSLTVTTSVSGVNGIDTGSIAASTLYYVYTVLSAGTVRLIASVSAVGPTGFTTYRKVGAFYTDGSFNIVYAYYFNELNIQSFTASMSAPGVISQKGKDWINGNATVSAGERSFSLLPAATLGISQPLNVTATLIGSNATVRINNSTTTTVAIETVTVPGTSTALAVYIVAVKTGVDSIQPDWSR